MDLVKVRGYGFETAADRRKGAAAVVACGLKEKRLPHQVRQSLFPPPHTAAAPPHSRNATMVRTGDDAGVVCAVSDADKRRFAEGPRVADAEPHRLRPVRIEVIGAVAHGATICRAVRSVKSERLIDIGAAAPASYPMARAQKVR
jgi:hypothetical protein